MSINFDKNNKESIIRKIQDFYLSERDEEIGIIAAESILDFFINELGDSIYNQALIDAKNFFNNKLESVEEDFETLYK